MMLIIPEFTAKQLRNFWRKVDVRGPNECWNWTAFKNPKGYGMLCVNKRTLLAHRCALALSDGPNPNSMGALHSCDNSACCNPRHLRWGTVADNMWDRDSRGRNAQCKGAAHGRAKLDEAKVCEIRASTLPARVFAEKHGVGLTVIYDIRRRKLWAHVA